MSGAPIPISDELLFDILVDPIDGSRLRTAGDVLVSASGRTFPIVQGVPVMLVDGVDQTIRVAERTLSTVRQKIDLDNPWQLETTVLDPKIIAELNAQLTSLTDQTAIDPVINYLICKTNGILYKQLVGKLKHYPIPDIRLPSASAASRSVMLDIGCSWGRWSISAARKGYCVVGLDPSLGAVLAGRRAAKSMGLNLHWVVGDARYLPFADNTYDKVFSYSVLQHFGRADVDRTLEEVRRVLTSQGTSLIQMANGYGVRSFHHMRRRGFTEPKRFKVRYYTPADLMSTFERAIGPSKISVDGFFGLGIQMSDVSVMPYKHRVVIYASELLRRASQMAPVLRSVADSLFVESKKRAYEGHASPYLRNIVSS
jgi:SAM-dependent methyltransferase